MSQSLSCSSQLPPKNLQEINAIAKYKCEIDKLNIELSNKNKELAELKVELKN
jgi:hypothetical protein